MTWRALSGRPYGEDERRRGEIDRLFTEFAPKFPKAPETTVGRCRLTVSKPALKAPMLSTLETIIS
jgi:hypothetical protein